MLRLIQWMYAGFFLALLTGCQTPPKNEVCTIKPKHHFRIATYNLNWDGNRFSATAPDKSIQILKQANADVVVFQEVTSFWFHALRTRLAYIYPYMEYKPSPYAGGLAFISKYPVHQVQYFTPPVKGVWHNGTILQVDTPSGSLQLLNLHLTPPLISKQKPKFAFVPYFSSCKIREKEIAYFYQKILKNKPTIIAGDFNEGDNSFVRFFLNQHGFLDAPNPDLYSWEWKLGPITMRRKLDHIFYNPYLKMEKVQIIHHGDSDHFPIVADFSIYR